jgi:hypothetical protein
MDDIARPDFGPIHRVCAWCKRTSLAGEWIAASEASDQEIEPVTHGICPDCLPGIMSEANLRIVLT